MGLFAVRTRQAPRTVPGARVELSDELRLRLPPRFEAVGEAFASGTGSVEACAALGRDLALDGTSLEEVLDHLRTTCRLVRGHDPDFTHVRSICGGWSESTLGYLHQVSCEDPLTGLASLAHVRSRIGDLYRSPRCDPHETHALVVVAVLVRGAGDNRLTADLRRAGLAETVRAVFSGAETIGSLGPDRIVVVADRDDRLGRRVALLRQMLGQRLGRPGSTSQEVRVWIEGLTDTEAGAVTLLHELARS